MGGRFCAANRSGPGRSFLAARPTGLAAAAVLLLSACSDDVPEVPEPASTEIPEELQDAAPPPEVPADEAQIGTPMEERVATLGLLNKRNNVSQDIELKPGEQSRFGNIIIRVQACERTAPWEMPQETGAFVQVFVEGANADEETQSGEAQDGDAASSDENGGFGRIFSGWLFKNSPSLNVVEHPVYEVWVKDCAMSFPGEVA